MELITKHKARLVPNPQALAWLVVAISFLTFCITCAASTYGAYWFFFQSPVSLTAHLIVSRGTVTVTRADSTSYVVNGNSNNSNQNIAANTVLQTDANAQAYLSIEDSGAVVANIFLLGNSNLSFEDATRPRFEWSIARYLILMNGASGQFTVDMGGKEDGLTRGSDLIMQSAAGAGQVHLEDGGSYQIDALDQGMTLYTQAGEGVLSASQGTGRLVAASMKATLTAGKIAMQTYPYIMLNLPEPGPVQDSFSEEKDPNNPPPGWACDNVPPDDPSEPASKWEWARLDERVVIQMSRVADRPLGHAETSCEYWFPQNPVGLDVSQFSSLMIRIKMKIMDQDVTTCGVVGSECPVMLDIEYLDPQNNVQHWYQGFYSIRPPADTSLLRCASCPHDHEQISKDAWYIYSTGELRNQSPFDAKPNDPKVYLRKIRVYSSGHRFDVALSEVTVMAIPGQTN